MKKIIFLTDIPTNHKIPLFNQIARLLKKENCEFKGIFLIPTEKRRKWQITLRESDFAYSILNEPRINLTYEWTLILPFFLVPRLFCEKPSLIITGGFSLSTMAVMLFYFVTGVRYVIWSGECSFTAISKSKLRTILRKIMILFASGAIVYGTKAAEYIKKLNNNKKIFVAYNTIDVNDIAKKVTHIRASEFRSIQQYGLSPQKINVLFVGGLVKRKGLHLLMPVLSRFLPSIRNFVLHIVGDGREISSLKKMVDFMRLSDYVIFWGFKERRQLINFYSSADLLVFPTLSDVWGLVINEAMSAGLPVVASMYAGASYDLIKDGINGFVVDPNNVEEMAGKIRILIENHGLRERMASEAQKIMLEKFTVEKSAQAFVDAIKYLFGHRL